jgi:hypothetical protein
MVASGYKLLAVVAAIGAALFTVIDFRSTSHLLEEALSSILYGNTDLHHFCEHAGHRHLPKTSSVVCAVQPPARSVGDEWVSVQPCLVWVVKRVGSVPRPRLRAVFVRATERGHTDRELQLRRRRAPNAWTENGKL